MYKYIHTCIYIHISCPHTSTHTHIYTHAYKMYIWTHAKYVWNDGAAATAREAQLDAKSSALLPVRITTARRPDHIHLSALVRSRSTQFIVHTSSQIGHGPRKRGHFPAILAGFFFILISATAGSSRGSWAARSSRTVRSALCGWVTSNNARTCSKDFRWMIAP